MTEDNIAVIVERLDNVKAGQDAIKKEFYQAQEKADAWRERFDNKLDQRPCVVHGKLLSSINIQLKGIWFFIALLLTLVFELLKEHFSK